MKVFFVGYMASGKSTLGKRVAKQLDLAFVDMDSAIEQKFGLSVPEIFVQHGEPAFRKAESDYLLELKTDQRSMLIATGGGVPCYNENMSLMNELGLTVYLNRPPKELAHRIFNSKKSRPLTDAFNEEELITFIETHLKARETFYMQSELIVDRSTQTTQGLIEVLLPYFSDFLKSRKR